MTDTTSPWYDLDSVDGETVNAGGVSLAKTPNTREYFLPGVSTLSGYRRTDRVEVCNADTAFTWVPGEVTGITRADDAVFDMRVMLDTGPTVTAFGTEIRPFR